MRALAIVEGVQHSDFTCKLTMLGMVVVLTGLTALGLGSYVFDRFPERESLQAVEGRVVAGSLDTARGDVCLRVEGYDRELVLVGRDDEIAQAGERLRELGAPRLRLRVEPWWNNADRASVYELERIDGEPEVVFAYQQARAYGLQEERAALVVGTTFGLFLGALLLLLALPRHVHQSFDPSRGRVSRAVYARRAVALMQLMPCLGLSVLFTWGTLTMFPASVLFAPLLVFFAGCALGVLPQLVRLGPTLQVGDEGLTVLGSRPIPWERIQRAELTCENLVVVPNDAEQRLASESLAFRLRAKTVGRLLGSPWAVRAVGLDLTFVELQALLATHGVDVSSLHRAPLPGAAADSGAAADFGRDLGLQ